MNEEPYTYVKYCLRQEPASGTITFYVPDDNSRDVRIVIVDSEHETKNTQMMNLADARDWYIQKIQEGYLLHSTDRSNSRNNVDYSPYKEYFSKDDFSYGNVIKKEDFEIAMELYDWTKRIEEDWG